MATTIVHQVVPETTRDGVDARNPDLTSSPVTVTQVLGMPAEQQGKKKRRTKAEIAAERDAKQKAKEAKTARIEVPETPANEVARRILATLRSHAETPVAIEDMYVLRKMFPPALNVNKFAVGSAVEDMFTDLLNACGFACENVAASTNVIDIYVTDEDEKYPFSIKNTGKLGSGIILENYRGKKKEIPKLPPSFIIATGDKEFTLMYLDDEILQLTADRDIYNHADSNLTMRGGFVKDMSIRLPDEYVVRFPAPVLPADIPVQNISRIIVDCVRKRRM